MTALQILWANLRYAWAEWRNPLPKSSYVSAIDPRWYRAE